MDGGMFVQLSNFTKAVEALKKQKQMTLEDFVKTMGYKKLNRHYIVSTVIPRALALAADDQTRKCFRLIRDILKKEYYVEWICHD